MWSPAITKAENGTILLLNKRKKASGIARGFLYSKVLLISKNLHSGLNVCLHTVDRSKLYIVIEGLVLECRICSQKPQ